MSEKGKFGWVINRDYLQNPDGKVVDVSGPKAMTATREEIESMGTHFRMFDDDDNLYFSGYVLADDSHDEFMPLDHYGMPSAGCTKIYLRDEDGVYNLL